MPEITINMKRRLLACAIFLMLLMTPLIVAAATTGSSSISPDTINNSGTATVTFTLTGDTAYNPTPKDIIFLIDGSGSMQQEGFDLAKTVITNTINALAAEDHFVNDGRIGLVLFADSNNTETILSIVDGDVQVDVLNAVQNLVFPGSGNSCMGDGVDLAVADFNTNSTPARNRLIVLVTDGIPICPNLSEGLDDLAIAGAAARNLGIPFAYAGVGIDFNPDNIEFLFDDPQSEIVFFPFEVDLTPFVSSLVDLIRVVDNTNYLYFDVDSRFDPPTNLSADLGQVDQFDNTVDWRLYGLGDTTATLTYDIAVDCSQGPEGDLPVHSYIYYEDNEGGQINFDLLSVTLNCFSDSDDDGVPDDEDDYPDDPSRSVECPAGSFGAHSCTLAPKGYYVADPGALAAEKCALGTFSDDLGATECTDAPAGNYVDVMGAEEATQCDPGTYQPNEGASSCVVALPGEFVAGSGATTVEQCSPGTYQDLAAQTSCNDAEPGTYVDNYGAEEAAPCPVGYYQDAYGAEACKEAPIGTYAPVAGLQQPKSCPAGTSTEGTAATSVDACLTDTDGDGEPDTVDTDDDNDGILDEDDAYPTVAAVTQVIALESGWNMISGYIAHDICSPDFVFRELSDQFVLVKNGAGDIYWPDLGIDTIGCMDALQSYQVYKSGPESMMFYGQVIDPGTISANLPSGWNMIGYWLEYPTAIDTGFSAISAQLKLVKDGEGLIYWPEFGINQIGDLQTGKGYQAYLNNPGTLSYSAND